MPDRLLDSSLPVSDDFPAWPDILSLHRDLMKAKDIDARVSDGTIPDLIDSTPGIYERAAALLKFLTERSAVQKRVASYPPAGRMYFYLGTPNGPYYDFIEFTVGASSINVDTTRVDRFGLKLAILLHGHDGSNQEIGEDY